MTSEELREEIAIELENIETVLRELSILHEDAKGERCQSVKKQRRRHSWRNFTVALKIF